MKLTEKERMIIIDVMLYGVYEGYGMNGRAVEHTEKEYIEIMKKLGATKQIIDELGMTSNLDMPLESR